MFHSSTLHTDTIVGPQCGNSILRWCRVGAIHTKYRVCVMRWTWPLAAGRFQQRLPALANGAS
eukprot:361967-Chlamydomonas_euryale.AAC.2